MRNYITVDGGTTNTRVYLVLGGEIVDSRKIGIGSKNASSRSALIPALHDAIGALLSAHGLSESDITAVIASGTILANCVDLSISEFDFDALAAGFEYADRHGLNEALFKTRVLKNIFEKDAVYTYSFFIGVLLKDEIKAILGQSAARIVIGSKAQIKRATAYLLGALSDKKIVVLDYETVDFCVVRGAVKIFEYGE